MSVTITASADPVCAGTEVTYTANPVNGGLNPVFLWYVNGVPENCGKCKKDPFINLIYTPQPGDVISVVLISDVACPASNPATGYFYPVVNPVLPVSVTITASNNNICFGTQVTFTAHPVNGGLEPSYEWYLNGGTFPLGTDPTFSYTPAAGDYVTVILTSSETCASGNPATATFYPDVTPISPIGVVISASQNPSCAGSVVTYTAVPTNGGSPPTYIWQVNGHSITDFTNDETIDYIPSNGDTIQCILVSTEHCTVGEVAWSNMIIPVVKSYVPVSVSITASADPVCSGTSVTYTAHPVNGGDSPVYDWHVNGGSTVSTENTLTYYPNSGDQVTVNLTSSELCTTGSPATASFYPVVNQVLPASVTITASIDDVCFGTSVVFTAHPVNGGLSPAYEWYLNSGTTPVGSDETYTYSPNIGDVVHVKMTSSYVCASGNPATANFSPTVNPVNPIGVTIAASQNPTCAGTTVTYTATPVNGGNPPTYIWQVNGNTVTDFTNDETYAYVPQNGDKIQCILSSTEKCTLGQLAYSEIITAQVNPNMPVSVSISTPTPTTFTGLPVTFTATPVNPGTSPVYQWVVNGSNVGPNSPVYTYVPANNDHVQCILTSNIQCATGNPATSNTVTVTVHFVPTAWALRDLTIHNGEITCYDATTVITVAGPPHYFTAESGSTTNLIAGQRIFIYPGTTLLHGCYFDARIGTDFCPPDKVAIVSANTIEEGSPLVKESASFKVYPNPTSGNFTLEQKGDLDSRNVKVEVYSMTGERILTEEIVGQKKHEFMFADAPTGLYFVKVIAGDYVETIKLIKSR